MPGKGSPVKPVRIPEKLLEEVELVIRRRNLHRPRAKLSLGGRGWWRVEEWTLSSFIITAIREKISKMERSRTRHKQRSCGV